MKTESWPVHNLADAVVKSMKRHKRKAADFYPTPADATQALLDYLPPPAGCLVREPACGDGAIARVLRANGFDVDASDLRRTGYGEGGVDYLNAPLRPTPAHVGNPPFALALEFIDKALQESDYVALLLKSNFFHTQNRLDLHERTPPTIELKITWRLAFLKEERGNNPLMDCSWFVWLRGEPRRGFEMLRRPSTYPDLSERPLSVLLADLRAAHEDLAETLRDA